MADIEKELTKFEGMIKELKFDYEQYFIGEAKLPPEKLRLDVEAHIRFLYGQPMRAAGKFRFQMLMARFNTYKARWDKVMRDIMEGITPRDRVRAKLKSLGADPSGPKEPADPLEKVYKDYIQAKQDQGEDVSKLTFSSIAQTLKSQGEKIKEKYKCEDVEFRVAVEGGKVKFKAVPK